MPRPRYVPPVVADARFPAALIPEQDRMAAGGDAEWSALAVEPGPRLLCLRLGPLELELRGEDAGIAAALRERWGEHEVAEPRAPVRVALRAVDRLPFPSPVAIAAHEVRAGRVLLKIRGLALAVDPAAGDATALVERGHPRQDLSNLVRFLAALCAPRHGAFLLRGAAVETRQGAVLAVGPRHAGKSTVARLAAPRPVRSDDAVLAEVTGAGRLRAHAIGLWGIEGSEGVAPAAGGSSFDVAALLLLRRAAGNRIEPLARGRAAAELCAAVTLPSGLPALRLQALAFASAAASAARPLAFAFHHRDGSCWDQLEALLADGGSRLPIDSPGAKT